MEFLNHAELTVDPMNGTEPTQTPTHLSQLQISAKDQKLAITMNIHFCWISMVFGFIRLYVKLNMFFKVSFSYLKVTVHQGVSERSGAATSMSWPQRGASQATPRQLSPSSHQITVEQNQFLNVFIWSLLLLWCSGGGENRDALKAAGTSDSLFSWLYVS